MLGYKQTMRKDLLGVFSDGFRERSFPFWSSMVGPGGGNEALFLLSLQLGTRPGVGGGSQSHPPPTFSVLEGKCIRVSLGLIFSESPHGGQSSRRDSEVTAGGSGVYSGVRPCGLNFPSTPDPVPVASHALLGTGAVAAL